MVIVIVIRWVIHIGGAKALPLWSVTSLSALNRRITADMFQNRVIEAQY